MIKYLHRVDSRRNLISPLVIFSLIVILFPSVVFGLPVITSQSSTTNGTSQYIQVNSGTPITFTITATGATNYAWFVDGQNQNHDALTFDLSPTALHSISAMAINGATNSSKVYWTIIVNRIMASSSVAVPDISLYDTFEQNITINPSLKDIISNSAPPYTHFIGNYFYLLLWGLVFMMIWIRTDKITIPSTLGFIIGATVIGSLPAQYQLVAQLVVVAGGFAAIYIFMRDRR